MEGGETDGGFHAVVLVNTLCCPGGMWSEADGDVVGFKLLCC